MSAASIAPLPPVESSTGVMPNLWLPVTLAFVAGFVDACTFLAFAGLFVAQATGSYVVAGSELVSDNANFAAKVLAIPVFIVAGMGTTCMVRAWKDRTRVALVMALCIEAALLVALTATGIAADAATADTIPALFGLAAMGVQSAAAHLLFPAYGSTNAMTNNTTQLAIDLTDSLLGRRVVPGVRRTGGIMLGFLVGVAAGGVAFKAVGLGCVLFAVAVVLAVAVVAARAEDAG
jgi:uncharacterized membrane protein YoaK (UPF0700 family)